jgi:hypothetical protein
VRRTEHLPCNKESRHCGIEIIAGNITFAKVTGATACVYFEKKKDAETNISKRKYIIWVAQMKQIIKDIAVQTKNGQKQKTFQTVMKESR